MSNTIEPMRGRFAPSPTGAIHLGNVWTALLAWLDARQHNGVFVLRIEDLDPERSRPQYIAQLMHDLRWLGLDWDEGPDTGGPFAPYVQDDRRDLYAAALERLRSRDLVYACYCSRGEMRAAASAPHGVAGSERCPNNCRSLSLHEKAAREQAGRKPHLRVRMPDEPTPIPFTDLCHGSMTEDVAQAAGDFVVQRADGVHAYQLAVVVDDAMMEITHVIRGADLLDSTARQIWLHEMLGYTPPRFGHVPLLTDREGHRLSKRHAALAIAELRAAGVRPAEIIGWLAYWAGFVPAPEAVQPHELIGRLDLARLRQAAIVIEPQALIRR